MPLPKRFQDQGRLDGWLGYRVRTDAERVGEERIYVLRPGDRPLQYRRQPRRYSKERVHFDRRPSLSLRRIACASTPAAETANVRKRRIDFALSCAIRWAGGAYGWCARSPRRLLRPDLVPSPEHTCLDCYESSPCADIFLP